MESTEWIEEKTELRLPSAIEHLLGLRTILAKIFPQPRQTSEASVETASMIEVRRTSRAQTSRRLETWKAHAHDAHRWAQVR